MNSRLISACLLALSLAACAQPGPTDSAWADLSATSEDRPRIQDAGNAQITQLSSEEASDADREIQAAAPAEYVPGRILVKATDGTALAKAAARVGGKVGKAVARLGVTVVDLPAKADVLKAAASARGTGIRYAEPDFIAQAHFTPDDPDAQNLNFTTNPLGKGWHLAKIQARSAWDGSKGEIVTETATTPIKIAICDTGIDQDHPDLASKIVFNANMTTASSFDDVYGHGSHTAGLAAGATHNGIGIAGVGFNASLLNIKVLDDTGNGAYSWIAAGIAAAADNGAQIINLSLGGKYTSQVMLDAVNYAYGKGALVVASAGNSNSTKASYPAYYTNAFAVAATTKSDARAYYSNYGSWVDIAAPGGGDTKMAFTSTDEGIWSTIPGSYGYKSGTSMAAPVVSGAAALVLAKYPTLTNAQLRARLQAKGDTLSWASYMKRLNANRAVNEP